MTDLIAELAEVVRLDGKATSGKWSVEAEGKNEFGQLEFAIEIYDGKCPIVGSGWFYGDPHDANIASAAVNFLRTHHVELTRILTDDAAIRAAHHDLVIRLGEVTTELEAARKDAERYRWMRENEWDEPVVKLYDGDFDNASGETLDSAIDAAMRESGK